MGSEGLASGSAAAGTVEHIARVQGLLHDVQLSLAGRALEHDASKLLAPGKETFERHHPQHFRDGVAGMNLVDLIVMLADWKAAALAGGDLGRSIGENAKRFGYGRELERVLWVTARDMGWL